MSNFKTKRTYKQQQTTKFMITCAVIVLILFFYVGSLVGLYYMITKHTDDFIFVGQVRLESIKSQTLAQMRQNDLQLVVRDVYASASSLSNLITNQDEALSDNFDIYGPNYIENSYIYTIREVDPLKQTG